MRRSCGCSISSFPTSTPTSPSSPLVLAITLHNIPEGLAVGVAFGGAAGAEAMQGVSLTAATALAMGIAIQNLPEGVAVAMPLRREGNSRMRAFWYGQLSAAVEPVAAVIGAAAVAMISPILPYALSFATGAMLNVVVEELLPAAQRSGHTDLVTSATMIGFAVMMLLDVGLGSRAQPFGRSHSSKGEYPRSVSRSGWRCVLLS